MTFSSPWRVKVRYSAAGKHTHRTHPPASERGGPPFGGQRQSQTIALSLSPPLFPPALLGPSDLLVPSTQPRRRLPLTSKTNEGSPEENRIGRRGRPPFSASFRGDRSPLLSLRRQIHFEKVKEEERRERGRRGKSGRDSTTYVSSCFPKKTHKAPVAAFCSFIFKALFLLRSSLWTS